jgi:branched-chain amino acid transport system ATP-binding protein
LTAPLLEIRGVYKHFGGLAAADGVDLDVRPGEIHALIGPNGAGKTTLINLISGELRPERGKVRFDGRELNRLPVHRRVHRGLARTYQIANVFGAFPAVDNVALAIQALNGHSFRFWRSAQEATRLREAALAMLLRVGLGGQALTPAVQLSHGERRQLGLAIALASRPRLLLLDEPMAGTGPKSSRQMVALLGGLKGQQAMLLVEHDMDVVFTLADRISVLVYGRIIASGPPEAIRENPAVREAYLGAEAESPRAAPAAES